MRSVMAWSIRIIDYAVGHLDCGLERGTNAQTVCLVDVHGLCKATAEGSQTFSFRARNNEGGSTETSKVKEDCSVRMLFSQSQSLPSRVCCDSRVTAVTALPSEHTAAQWDQHCHQAPFTFGNTSITSIRGNQAHVCCATSRPADLYGHLCIGQRDC